MRRRTFLQLPPAALAADLRLLAEAPMPMATLGKSGLKVSRFCVGGYHMAVKGDEMGVRIIHRAMDLGVNFFDCAWLYHDGRSDSVYGKALGDGHRQKVLVMSKAHHRTRDGAMKQLEDTLGRMKTDYLDLWQCHQVTEQKEVDQILGPAGALEAFVKAKQQGKVRHIGFTGHADPAVHQRMLDSFDGWETVQHPVNLIDPHYLSFINSVMPNVRKKGLGLLAMKSNGMGAIGKASIAPIAECLRFAWSHDVDVVVSGVETVEQLEQNVAVLKTLKPMSKREIAAVLERTRKGPHGSKVEGYKKKEGAAGGPVHRDGEPG
ncbi:MAG: aldo/keto reductase [Bryobacterales bacterium]|nr:aldo/keto reductase [Bryobacterales bacterium]